MAGYLDTYGVVEERRGRIIKRVALWAAVILVVSSSLYFYFRTWREERLVKRFLSALSQQDFQDGYRIWGCTQDNPCPNYPPTKFNEDWGPSTPYSRAAQAKIENIDYCNGGVVFKVSFPQADPVSLWVERGKKAIGFAPWPRCPGRHLEIRQFLKALFSKPSPDA